MSFPAVLSEHRHGKMGNLAAVFRTDLPKKSDVDYVGLNKCGLLAPRPQNCFYMAGQMKLESPPHFVVGGFVGSKTLVGSLREREHLLGDHVLEEGILNCMQESVTSLLFSGGQFPGLAQVKAFACRTQSPSKKSTPESPPKQSYVEVAKKNREKVLMLNSAYLERHQKEDVWPVKNGIRRQRQQSTPPSPTTPSCEDWRQANSELWHNKRKMERAKAKRDRQGRKGPKQLAPDFLTTEAETPEDEDFGLSLLFASPLNSPRAESEKSQDSFSVSSESIVFEDGEDFTDGDSSCLDRSRCMSESSVAESEDSIVFCEEFCTPELSKSLLLEEQDLDSADEWSESESEEDDSECDDVVDGCLGTRKTATAAPTTVAPKSEARAVVEDEFAALPPGVECLALESEEEEDEEELAKKVLEEVNRKWKQMVAEDEKKICKGETAEKKVQFSEKEEVHCMVAWDFAYRAARCGPWEMCARDRKRFGDRVERTGKVLAPALDPQHRRRIYEQRFLPE